MESALAVEIIENHKLESVPVQARDENALIGMWLHGRPAGTRRGYENDLRDFQSKVCKPLRSVTVGDLQAWVDTLDHLGVNTQARRITAIRSLFSFATRVGYIRFNPGAVIRPPKTRDVRHERTLSETEVHAMIAGATGRDRALLRLMYATGCRTAEIAGLSWKDCIESGDGRAVLSVVGKGEKQRYATVPAGVWQGVAELRGDSGADDPVFRSRKGGRLSGVREGLLEATRGHKG